MAAIRRQRLLGELPRFPQHRRVETAGLTLAVVKYGLFVDHWVTLLEVTDSEVVVGDPLGGLGRFS